MSVAHTWGTSPEERALAYPCDGLLARVDLTCWRGVDVAANPATLFRWLCQLRAAPYSYDWIDNRGRRSPRTLTPGLERLEVGQRVMSIFELVAFEPDVHLTLRSGRFVPDLWRGVAVSYVIRAVAPRRCRLLVKLVAEVRPGPLGAAAKTFLAWGDLVMMRRQLLNLKALAEGRRR